ncbi:energy transducer TonB [Croceicoccus bisphenolivorans]|uniref:energy transducer TonB n=1 Tax=Croceicoccus bisphenolivorans TaxID=1783232 RepID=UPI00082F6CED|nr:energy transducer TonB [Croceicoccus bisphenolivorans]
MAYTDTRHDPNRGATIATVALIHVGLGYAIVSGFAGGVINEATDTFKSIWIPEDKVEIIPLDPPVVPDPAPSQASEPKIVPVPTPWDTNVDFKVPDVPIPDTLPTAYSTDVIEIPIRETTPAPKFTPKAAVPKGNPGRWVRESDYPSRMVRLGIEGRTGFRLSISATGNVTGCEITRSSGAAELDRAACDALRDRATFKGATDGNGNPVAGTYESTIVWQLPD